MRCPGCRPTSRTPLASLAAELRARRAVYLHDWAVAARHPAKVASAALYMFFISIFPALTFGNSLAASTSRAYGIPETLLTTALTGALFAAAGGQPLVILGVTGPVTVFSATLYALTRSAGLPFLPFMFWVCAWAAAMHVALAAWNWCDDVVRWVTRFSCEVFGLMIAAIYLYDGARGLASRYTGNTPEDLAPFFLSLLITLTVPLLALRLHAARTSWLLTPRARALAADYALSASVLLIWALATATPPWNQVPLPSLPVPLTFGPSTPRPWLVPFWDIGAGWAVVAVVPGFILTALFLFDHNVSSLLAQRPELELKKPPAFNYDFLVVGACLLLCGALGLPVANGLIPQSDLHVMSLLHTKPLRRRRQRHWWSATTEEHELPLDGSYHAAVVLAPKGGMPSFYAPAAPPHEATPQRTPPTPPPGSPPPPLPSSPPAIAPPAPVTPPRPAPPQPPLSPTRSLLPKSQAALDALFPPQFWMAQYVSTHGYARGEEEERFVVETRVSGLLQSLGIGLMLLPPSLRLLHGMPPSLLYGTFVYMGLASFAGNQFFARLAALTVTQPTYRLRRYAAAALSPLLLTLPTRSVVLFTALQFAAFVVVTVITIAGGPAAISFPLLILLLIPLRHRVFPRLFPAAHLAILDSWTPPDLPSTSPTTQPPPATPPASPPCQPPHHPPAPPQPNPTTASTTPKPTSGSAPPPPSTSPPGTPSRKECLSPYGPDSPTTRTPSQSSAAAAVPPAQLSASLPAADAAQPQPHPSA